MIDATTVRPLSDFKRDADEHLQRLKDTGLPEVLTVNGQAELVVQSAAAYQKLVEQADANDSVRTLRDRLAAADAGEPGVPADQVLDAVARRLGLRGSA